MTGAWRGYCGVLLVCAATVGCDKLKNIMTPAPAVSAAAAPKPPDVLFTLPTTAEITDFEDFTGRTVARRTIEIRRG